MAQINRDLILNEANISEILKYFDQKNAIEKNKEFIIGLKKRKAGGNITLGIVIAVLSVLATIYGVADVFGDEKLPLGIIFLIGGPIGVFFSLVVIAKGFDRLVTASRFSNANSMEELCKQFYYSAFCKVGTDTESRDDYLIDTAHLIPAPVWEIYQNTGWSFIEGKSKKLIGKSEPVECEECHKKHEHSGTTYISLPISGRDENAEHKRQSTYLQCSYCKHKICYNCMDKMHPKELKYICPACGKATNGKGGLSERWELCRRKSSRRDNNFTISQISINQETHIGDRAVNIVVNLKGSPYGSIKFRNVAISIGNSWFLASPEPVKGYMNSRDQRISQ